MKLASYDLDQAWITRFGTRIITRQSEARWNQFILIKKNSSNTLYTACELRYSLDQTSQSHIHVIVLSDPQGKKRNTKKSDLRRNEKKYIPQNLVTRITFYLFHSNVCLYVDSSGAVWPH